MSLTTITYTPVRKGEKIQSLLTGNWIDYSKEEELRQQFIFRLIHSYGYDKDQIGEDVRVSEADIADIAIWKSPVEKEEGKIPDIFIMIKCKAEYITIEKDEYFKSLENASLLHLDFFVASNLKETKAYYLDHTASPKQLERVPDFPKASIILSEEKMNAYIKKVRATSRDNFVKALNKCHNIIRNIEKLSPEAAFDEISKVLFIKMFYENHPGGEITYTKAQYFQEEKAFIKENSNQEYFQYLFQEVKGLYRMDHIFEKDEKIYVRRDTFLLLIEVLENINLHDATDDTKGVAFETFLGKTFRGELGQFFTPRTVVDFMVSVLDIKEGELVCDPCCGSGGFLIRTFDYVQDKIDQDIRQRIDEVKTSDLSREQKRQQTEAILSEISRKDTRSRYYRLTHNYFYGVDANIRMVRTSKMNMIMHGDGHVGVYRHDGLTNVGGVYDNRFDVVLINPPFGAHVDRNVRITESDYPSIEEIQANRVAFGSDYDQYVLLPLKEEIEYVNSDQSKGKRIVDLFGVPGSTNTEVLFVERTLQLLKPGGRAGIILPDGVLNNKNLARMRRYIEGRATIFNVTSLPADVFMASGASIKPSIIFLRKNDEATHSIEHELASSTRIQTITKISYAGISSIGLPTKNELPQAAREIRYWLKEKQLPEGTALTKVVKRKLEDNWAVDTLFEKPEVRFNPLYPKVQLGSILHFNKERTEIKDDKTYTRLTVRLFNNGIRLRDQKLGKLIGTKKQTIVHAGMFLISKIDGKSGAFGIVPKEFDGAVVTQDFMSFTIDYATIDPEFLTQVLYNDAVLKQFLANSSGTTRRKRLSQKTFEQTYIPLPSIEEQQKLIGGLSDLRRQHSLIDDKIEEAETAFRNSILTDNEN